MQTSDDRKIVVPDGAWIERVWPLTLDYPVKHPVTVEMLDAEVHLRPGEARLRVRPYDLLDRDKDSAAYQGLCSALHSISICRHEEIGLKGGPSWFVIRADGVRARIDRVDTGPIVLSGTAQLGFPLPLEYLYRDSTRLVGKVAKWMGRDPHLSDMMSAMMRALHDSTDEFIHLFDIVEVLERCFGTRAKAAAMLGVSGKRIRRLAKLANDAPVSQGRHRGLHANLRSATTEELHDARSIAIDLLEAYCGTLG